MQDRKSINRRTFLQGAAAVTAGAAWINPSKLFAEGGNKLRVLGIGTGGQGAHDIVQVSEHPDTTIVGCVDVDLRAAERAAGRFDCDAWQDYRQAFRDLGDGFDAVVVSTPDHMHAPIAMAAMNMDKHVYCQKPLTWCVAESRALSQAAQAKSHLATQMGTQWASRGTKRQVIAAIKEGIIGKVEKVYAWSDRPAGWWPQGVEIPAGEDAVPDYLDWDLWIGGAPMRPYKNDTYAPFKWRGVKDFGTGAIGDMACHIADVPFYALGLTNPTSMISQANDVNDDTYPSSQNIELTFAGNSKTAGDSLKLYWSDGGIKPTAEDLGAPDGFDVPQNTCFLVGTEGTIGIRHEDGMVWLWVNGESVEFQGNSRLRDRNHYHHWVDACMGWGETETHFAFASKLTESMVLGTLASRFAGTKLEWDADNMRVTNHEAANAFIARDYREGWAVDGL
ncbi:MAG: Gfo/Idh/MocA family oxidoreductase [Phycisphaerales bacterium JB063]